jgi:large subunit ribosomal protein L17
LLGAEQVLDEKRQKRAESREKRRAAMADAMTESQPSATGDIDKTE